MLFWCERKIYEVGEVILFCCQQYCSKRGEEEEHYGKQNLALGVNHEDVVGERNFAFDDVQEFDEDVVDGYGGEDSQDDQVTNHLALKKKKTIDQTN